MRQGLSMPGGAGILALWALALPSCNSCRSANMAKWEIVTRWPQYHQPFALWFEKGTGLLLGQHRTLEQLLDPNMAKVRSAKEAFILRGEGDFRSWSKVYSGRGEFRSVSSPEHGLLYALGVSTDEEGNNRAFLVSSADLGRTWAPLPPPPIPSIGVAFYEPKAGYVWSVERLYQTQDGGQTWRDIEFPLHILDGFPPPVVDKHGTVWVVGKAELRSVEKSGQRSVVSLPEGFRADLLALDSQGRPWLAGHQPTDGGGRGPLELLTLPPGARELQRVSKFPNPILLAEHLCVGRGTIFLIASDIGETPPVSQLQVSTDEGRKWKRESPAITRSIGAVFVDEDETIWATASADRLQRRRR